MSTSPSFSQGSFEPPPLAVPLPDSAYLASEECATCPQFVLFGDSITQFGTLTLQPYLQTQYVRRLDVVNRGFGGYTARMGLSVLPKILPLTPSCSSIPISPTTPRVKLLTIFFGANDACRPGVPQHVPLTEYTDSLRRIVQYPLFKTHETKIIIITPPPVDEHQLGNDHRNAASTATYALGAREVAAQLRLPCLDLWTIFMRKTGWTEHAGREMIPGSRHEPPNSMLAEFLSDGLHLNKLGYDLLFFHLMNLIKRDIPEVAPEALPFALVDWRTALGVPQP